MSEQMTVQLVTHLVDGVDVPGQFDILERFRVCIDNERKRIPKDRADGYFGIWHDGLQIGVWYFTIVDGLVGPKRSHLLNWPAMFEDLMVKLIPYMPEGYYLNGCTVKSTCAPHLLKYPSAEVVAITLF